LQRAYEYLPRFLQQGIVVWNKRNITLENGSRIRAGATSSGSIRGQSYNIIFLDEFAHINNALAEDFFMSTYPTISSGQTTKCFMVSTPRGMNMFYKMWVDAQKAQKLPVGSLERQKCSQYVPVEIHWSQIPGRDEKWRDETIANTSEEQFAQEFECEFIGSSNTLISGSRLRVMPFQDPLYSQNGLMVYEVPKEGHKYVMPIDTAQGKQLDYSAFPVIDVTQFPYRVVAKYRSNVIAPMLFPNVIYDVARKYNEAHLLVEINDGAGQQVVEMMHYDFEYPNIFTCVSKGRAGQRLSAGFSKSVQMGVKTTQPVKTAGCANMKSLIESNRLIVEDFDIISELTTFVQKGNSYAADEGANDDLVMCLVIFSWLVTQKHFKELIDHDIRVQLAEDNEAQLEHDLTPFGFVVNGKDYDSAPEDEQPFTSGGDLWTPVKTLYN
jgi:hypothetical protein